MNNAFALLKTVLLITGYLLMSASLTVAQPLSPEAEVPCDTAVSSNIPLNPAGNEAAVCTQRTYQLPATDTLALRQENYDTIEVEAWDGTTIRVEAVVVARRATDEAAQSDVARITLNRADAGAASTRLFAAGPDSDAPGWWSIRYRLRVPAQTTLDISSKNGGIAVRDVVGAHQLRSENGSLTYRLPTDAGARLRAETENGIIETTFPVTTQGTVSTRYLEIVVGEGGPESLLTTRNGNVTIQRTD
ncbi:MAG: hypothetical protein GVY15_11870 [Bacteroidetes bacterium]|jgi:hypothetical protein|nr:hypothetical protein [Bacteroidota bacterium]